MSFLEAGELSLRQGDLNGALEALRPAVRSEPDSPRAHGALGSVLMALGRFQEAIPALRQAVRLSPTTAAEWHNSLGVALCQTGDMAAAETSFLQAARAAKGSAIDTGTALVNLVDLYRIQGRYSEALECLRQAFGQEPGRVDVLAHFGLLSWELEEWEGVRAALEQLQSKPTVRAEALPVSVAGWPVARLEAEGRAVLGEVLAGEIRSLSPLERAQRLAVEPRRQSQPPRRWAANEIALFCQQHLEKWSPRNLAQGIGGSEEAVIYLSRELAQLGWKVTVYGNPVNEAGDYEGVTYRSYFAFNPVDQFNLLIGWRGVNFFRTHYAAKGAYLWLHDVPRAERFTAQRLRNLNRIFVLSQFHRDRLPAIPDERFVVTGNGIDVAQIERLEQQAGERRPQRCIYASSYTRGLETLLRLWPEVRQAVPEAELHVFYGWQTFDALNKDDADGRAWRTQMERQLAQPGVIHHGRVGQAEILAETFRSGLWAYPTHFPEISCITAMKCQAAGAVPVTSNFAALAETVHYGVKLEGVDDRPYTSAQRAAYTQALIRALQDVDWQERTRQAMMPWARQTFSWKNVAHQWDQVFRADTENSA